MLAALRLFLCAAAAADTSGAARLAHCDPALAERVSMNAVQCRLSCVPQNTARSASGNGVNVSALTLALCVYYECVREQNLVQRSSGTAVAFVAEDTASSLGQRRV